jgi:cyclophilin family peptidyl-prolyl cis-trans isomerase
MHSNASHILFLFSPRTVSKDFLAQIGDPTATGTGGESIWSLIASQKSISEPHSRYFAPELVPQLKHTSKGTVSMAVAPEIGGKTQGGCGSQFFITLADNITYLDGRHAVFGHVVEGLETLDKLNEVYTDQDGRPFKDVRIRHVIVLGEFIDVVRSLLPLKSISMSIRRSISRPFRAYSTTFISYSSSRQLNTHCRRRRCAGHITGGGCRTCSSGESSSSISINS